MLESFTNFHVRAKLQILAVNIARFLIAMPFNKILFAPDEKERMQFKILLHLIKR